MKTGLRINVGGALLITLLMAAGAPESPVADAAARGDMQAVRMLLRQGADVNAAQGDGMTALHWAAMSGSGEMVDVLLYAGGNPESTTRLGGYTPLHLAAKAGYADAEERLLAGGARAEARTTTGVTALHYAAAAGREDAVSVLLRHGSEVDVATASDDQTPLMWATAYNRLGAMRTLLAAGADVSLTSRVVDYVERAAGDRPARQLRNTLVSAQQASEKGELPGPAQGGQGRQGPGQGPPQRPTAAPAAQPALAPAARAPGEEEKLAAQPQDKPEEVVAQEEVPEDEEVTEEDVATEEEPEAEEQEKAEEPKAEEQALSYDQLVGKEGGFTALHFASRAGYFEAAELLLAGGADVNQPTAGDATSPLLMATVNGNFDLAMDFLEKGADPNQVSEDDVAPLFMVLNRRWGPKAAYPQPQMFTQQETDYLELLEALLDAGADVNHRTGRHIWYTSFNFDQLGVQFAGATAFWRAAYATDVPAMKLLVAHGADPSMPTRKVPTRRFVFDPTNEPKEDPSGLPDVPLGGPGVYPIQAASGVGYGEGFAANSHSHAPDSWLSAVAYLVEELGADVNTRDLNGYSAVHHAAARGDNELISYLVSQGADVMTVSRRGETTVDMANGPRQRVQPFPETIALLEGLGAKNNDNCQSC